MWRNEGNATKATYRMQLAIDKLTAWPEEWSIAINKEKSSTTLFTLSLKQKARTIKLGNTQLRSDDEPIYLGVTLDKKQTWKPHLKIAEANARRKLAILHKLTGANWGANMNTLKVYEGTVRPHLENGSSAGL